MPHHGGDYQPELVIGRGERMILCEAESQSNIPDKNLERGHMNRILHAVFCMWAVLLWSASTIAAEPAKPKVRAITAFVKIDYTNYRSQIDEALQMLRSAKTAYEKAGYEVESVRVTTQPFPEYTKGMSRSDVLAFFHDFDAFSLKQNFLPNIGPAVIGDSDDISSFALLGEVLAKTRNLKASAVVAGDDGIHWNAVRATAKLVKYLEENSPRSQGNFNFAATAFLGPYAPFFPGSWHNGPGHKFAVGLESANVVYEVFAQTGFNPKAASENLKGALAREAKAAEAIARRVAESSGWEYLGLDPTPAPLKDVSIGAAIEKFTGRHFGSSSTITAVFIISEAVKSVPVKQIGYSGLMLPVLEDSRIEQRWSEGALSIDALLAYSSVCGTGLDTVPLPGDVTEEQLTGIVGDVASLAYKWKKPLTARLQPVMGKRAGEKSDFDDPHIVNAVLQPLP